MLPYKVTVEFVACLWAYRWFELAQSPDCRSNLYQRTHMKLVSDQVWDIQSIIHKEGIECIHLK